MNSSFLSVCDAFRRSGEGEAEEMDVEVIDAQTRAVIVAMRTGGKLQQ